MRQVTGLISTYSSDAFGVCSALYELGGMVVMHDASGCNSTYTTHDEPRWYDMDSMIFISAISEMEAILGDDEKLIGDLIETAADLHPKFIALVGAPIPYMIGTDLEAIANIVEHETGIPCFGIEANGMHPYTKGVSMALKRLVEIFAEDDASLNTVSDPELPLSEVSKRGEPSLRVNILGATPLDFSLNHSVEAIGEWLRKQGMEPWTCLSMGCSLADVQKIGSAQVNLVVSYGGLAAAKYLKERFGMPYVVGIPFGEIFSEHLAGQIRQSVADGRDRIAYLTEELHDRSKAEDQADDSPEGNSSKAMTDIVMIGESVFSASLAAAIELDRGIRVKVLCPVDTEDELLRPTDLKTLEEDDLIAAMEHASAVIADPLYRGITGEREFYPLPHEAFSGRIYDAVNPNLIGKSLKGNEKKC